MSNVDLPSHADLVRELGRLSAALDDAIAEARDEAVRYARLDTAYRLSRSRATLTAARELARRGISKPTVDQRQAYVDEQCAEEMEAAHASEGLRQVSMEVLRARRGQLSALQTVAAALRAEAETLRLTGGA